MLSLAAVDPVVTFFDDDGITHPEDEENDMFGRNSPDDALTRVPLFEGLTTNQLRVVSRLSTGFDLPAGRTLARQGAVGTEFFVVLQGQVEVVRGRELVATRGPGSPLGEIALLGARPRTATLITQTPLRGRVASQREFAGLLAEVPEISRRLHLTMVDRLAI